MSTISSPSVTLYGVNQYLYDECRDEEVLLVGGAGTGKTIGALKKLVDSCLKYPGSHHLLCRQTRESLTDSTLPTLESIIGTLHANLPQIEQVRFLVDGQPRGASAIVKRRAAMHALIDARAIEV